MLRCSVPLHDLPHLGHRQPDQSLRSGQKHPARELPRICQQSMIAFGHPPPPNPIVALAKSLWATLRALSVLCGRCGRVMGGILPDCPTLSSEYGISGYTLLRHCLATAYAVCRLDRQNHRVLDFFQGYTRADCGNVWKRYRVAFDGLFIVANVMRRTRRKIMVSGDRIALHDLRHPLHGGFQNHSACHLRCSFIRTRQNTFISNPKASGCGTYCLEPMTPLSRIFCNRRQHGAWLSPEASPSSRMVKSGLA